MKIIENRSEVGEAQGRRDEMQIEEKGWSKGKEARGGEMK
jgi:hypothetical protein